MLAGATQAPTTVLIVEDNEDNLFTLRAILAPMSFEIVAASTGRQAIDHCRAQLPDLVIMDMQMPGMSGLQATGAIRALPGGADVPILALTAQAMKGDRERILEAGCDAYLPKPVAPRELRAMVTNLIESRRTHAAASLANEGSRMARILLVDNEAGDRRAAARALGIRDQELEQVESVATALVRAAEAGHPFVLVSPAMLEASLGARPSSSGDLLRETFDVFEDGVCLLARNGALKVANAIGERLFRSTLQAELQSVASEASSRSATADRSLSLEGRAFAVRAYPLSERGVVLYIRDATDEREREIGRLQSEKLASIGMLAAGVAHEINNPAAFVLANIEALTGHMRLIEDKLRELPDADAGARGAVQSAVRGQRHPAGVEGGDGAHSAHRARPRIVLARRRGRERPHQRQRRGRVRADDAAQRAQVPRARRAGPARDAAGAGQRAAARDRCS